ncbi:hypothetical protein MYCTH_2108406 [Thermothelomyces thermophilus ATCC 42464]|uniref:Cytochrome P450-like protein n=1 Tax=Thermothelomyces thermophilus (strain ATCC 42464 / BCRC 31852 / DSM 1799) TaxID=573729 RepID=G2QA69_THET4|nr:uncharacterized protein MYCTH_2108406 [Thermothelomyces thermophilus ATCC 42464]AEO55817.1 hypothetical protein MYCTH_2108406 [Thermothelomyces thermophilus ATCC 42464]
MELLLRPAVLAPALKGRLEVTHVPPYCLIQGKPVSLLGAQDWVIDQPDSVLNRLHAPDPSVVHDPVHDKLITTNLTNQIGNLVPDVAEETAWDAPLAMQKLDSVMRESARLNSFVTVGLSRVVVAKDGVVTPAGVKIPRGAAVSVPSYPVSRDNDIYPGADEFRPFRFAEQRADDSVEYVKQVAKAFATTSTDYPAFGHSRNACPGRFFAANDLKLILAHLVLNYDIRPRNSWLGLNRVPPLQATIPTRYYTYKAEFMSRILI